MLLKFKRHPYIKLKWSSDGWRNTKGHPDSSQGLKWSGYEVCTSHFILQYHLQVSPKSTTDKIEFKSNFMGSFSAGLFIPPNTIDFERVFKNFLPLLAENPYVIGLICLILGVYIFLLIWARRKDKHDAFMVRIIFRMTIHVWLYAHM